MIEYVKYGRGICSDLSRGYYYFSYSINRVIPCEVYMVEYLKEEDDTVYKTVYLRRRIGKTIG